MDTNIGSQRRAAVLLSLLQGRLSPSCWRELLRSVSDDQAVCDPLTILSAIEALAKNGELHPSQRVVSRVLGQLQDFAAEIVLRCDRDGVCIVPISDSSYPSQLRALFASYAIPQCLFTRGRDPERLAELRGIGVVGSRAAVLETEQLAMTWSRDLVRGGFSVISGLAYGADGAAHRGALLADSESYGGDAVPTIAVLGSGLDTIYPRVHIGLAEQIVAAGGILVSQFPPGTPPLPRNFLQRNVTIAGMSLGVVVLQAAERSGALSTARRALELGREVICVPGPPWDARFAGGNALIKDGATVATTVTDVFRVFSNFSLSTATHADDRGAYYSPVSMLPSRVSSVLQFIERKGAVSLAELVAIESDPESLVRILLDIEIAGLILRRRDGRIESRRRT